MNAQKKLLKKYELNNFYFPSELFGASQKAADEERIKSARTANQMCTWLDGDSPQVDATLDLIGSQAKQLNILVNKTGAGCSGIQSRNDLAKSHAIMHAKIRSESYQFMSQLPESQL